MMKKLIAVVLALALAFSLSTLALASDITETSSGTVTFTYDSTGDPGDGIFDPGEVDEDDIPGKDKNGLQAMGLDFGFIEAELAPGNTFLSTTRLKADGTADPDPSYAGALIITRSEAWNVKVKYNGFAVGTATPVLMNTGLSLMNPDLKVNKPIISSTANTFKHAGKVTLNTSDQLLIDGENAYVTALPTYWGFNYVGELAIGATDAIPLGQAQTMITWTYQGNAP